jgi:hypothetical protein
MSAISQEAVAGLWPVDLGEANITEVWPSICANPIGRVLGKLYALPIPLGLVFAIATMPVALALWAMNRLRRYSLTTQHVGMRKGLGTKAGEQVSLAELEDVRIVARPGQAFYRAADLELISGGRVALTLPGVPNPETFRHNILVARDALQQVSAYRRAEETSAAASEATARVRSYRV